MSLMSNVPLYPAVACHDCKEHYTFSIGAQVCHDVSDFFLRLFCIPLLKVRRTDPNPVKRDPHQRGDKTSRQTRAIARMKAVHIPQSILHPSSLRGRCAALNARRRRKLAGVNHRMPVCQPLDDSVASFHARARFLVMAGLNQS